MNAQAKSQPMTVDDLQALYSELRGSRSAPSIMDARAHFLERQMQEALTCLQDAYEKYSESRQRVLRQDPEKQVDAKAKDRDRQVRRLKRKQDKAREIIGSLEEYIKQLEKLAEKESARAAAKAPKAIPQPEESEPNASDDSQTGVAVVAATSIDAGFLEQFAKLIGDRQLEFVSSQYGFVPLESSDDIRVDAVYLFRRKDRCVLINVTRNSEQDPDLNCVDLCNPKNTVQLSPSKMIRLSENRRLVLLLAK